MSIGDVNNIEYINFDSLEKLDKKSKSSNKSEASIETNHKCDDIIQLSQQVFSKCKSRKILIVAYECAKIGPSLEGWEKLFMEWHMALKRWGMRLRF